MDDGSYSCSRCRRPITVPRSRALELLAARKVRCQICGSPLDFPPDVLAEFESLSKRSTPVVRQADAACPICGRAVRGDANDPERILRCSYCGAGMRLPIDGSGCRLPPLNGAAASIEDVMRGLLYMPHDEGEIARHALLARAAMGEVAPGGSGSGARRRSRPSRVGSRATARIRSFRSRRIKPRSSCPYPVRRHARVARSQQRLAGTGVEVGTRGALTSGMTKDAVNVI